MVGSGVGVSTDVVAVGEGVSVGAGTVAVGVEVTGEAVGVAVLLAVGVGVATWELLIGPPLTVTAFVCACPDVPSPRTEVDPFGTNVGTLTSIFALPVLLVVTCAICTKLPFLIQRIRTVSWAA